MTYVLAVITAIALGVCAWALLLNYKTLKELSELTYKEREQFLQRIQDPVSAVAIHAQEMVDEQDGGVGVYTLPFDDDEAQSEYERLTDGRDG